MLMNKASRYGFSMARKAATMRCAVCFSSQASEGPRPFVNSNEKKQSGSSQQHQSRSYSAASGSSGPPAPPGTDYLSLFQPSYGNALTGYGAYSPGSVLKVYPLPRFVLKEDIINHVQGSGMDADKVKMMYTPTFRPDYVEFQTESAASQKQLMKQLQERGRLGCRFLRAEVSTPVPWTFVDRALKDAPRGRTLVMYNVFPTTDIEDVERFFQGYNYDPHHINFIKITNDGPNRMANRRTTVVHVAVSFTSKLEALRALREKAGDFCSRSAVNLRLIQ